MMIVVYKCVVFLSFIKGFGKQGEGLPCSPQFHRSYCKKTVNFSVVNGSLAAIGYCNPKLFSQLCCDWVT